MKKIKNASNILRNKSFPAPLTMHSNSKQPTHTIATPQAHKKRHTCRKASPADKVTAVLQFCSPADKVVDGREKDLHNRKRGFIYDLRTHIVQEHEVKEIHGFYNFGGQSRWPQQWLCVGMIASFPAKVPLSGIWMFPCREPMITLALAMTGGCECLHEIRQQSEVEGEWVNSHTLSFLVFSLNSKSC